MERQQYYRAISRIMKAGSHFVDQATQALKPFGITEPQYNVLRILDELEGQPATVQHIQGQMVKRSSNVTRIIDKLLEKDLVNREQDADNRRKVAILLTERGKTLLETLDEAVERTHDPTYANVSHGDLVALENLLDKLMGSSQ